MQFYVSNLGLQRVQESKKVNSLHTARHFSNIKELMSNKCEL